MKREISNKIALENQRVWTKIIAGCGIGFSVVAALAFAGTKLLAPAYEPTRALLDWAIYISAYGVPLAGSVLVATGFRFRRDAKRFNFEKAEQTQLHDKRRMTLGGLNIALGVLSIVTFSVMLGFVLTGAGGPLGMTLAANFVEFGTLVSGAIALISSSVLLHEYEVSKKAVAADELTLEDNAPKERAPRVELKPKREHRSHKRHAAVDKVNDADEVPAEESRRTVNLK